MRPSHGWLASTSPPTAHSSSTMRPSTAPATTASLTATQRPSRGLDLERRQLDDLVLACEDPCQPGLQLGAGDRAEEADAPEVDSDHRDAGAEKPRQRAQHRAVAAEHDGEVGCRLVAVGGDEPVLPGLLGGEDQLHVRLARHRLQARESGADLARLAVGDDRGPSDRLRRPRRRRRRSSGRRHRVQPAPRCRSGG